MGGDLRRAFEYGVALGHMTANDLLEFCLELALALALHRETAAWAAYYYIMTKKQVTH